MIERLSNQFAIISSIFKLSNMDLDHIKLIWTKKSTIIVISTAVLYHNTFWSLLILQQDTNKKIRADRVKELKDAKDQAEAKSKKQIEENNKKIQALQKRVCFKS